MNHTTEPASAPPPRKILSHLNFPVVGIGAAAGGLQALRQFFERMPDANGMAFVIILHLSPRLESSVYRILQRVTGMPVVQVMHPVPVEKNHIYIISPSLDLSMSDGYLRVSKAEPVLGRHRVIDLFFQTLADAHRHWAYGIVLTGIGNDGARGLACIKAQGGLTLAQSPADAEYAEMPRNAIATGKVDQVLPLAEMSRWLLRNCSGHMVTEHPHPSGLRRFERRMPATDLTELSSRRGFFLGNAAHPPPLPGARPLGVARFFHHPHAFAALAREVLASLYAEEGARGREIRVWSAGCSTGEEPYSLAMLLCEQARRSERPGTFQVFATDIDEQAVAIGRAGLYPHTIVSDVTPQRLQQFFNKEQAHYRIKKELRQKVLFAVHNLLRDPPFCKLDLICCRHLLSDLTPEMQREVLRTYHFALAPDGYLFLGGTDSADGCAELFTPVDKRNRLYRAKRLSSQERNRSASSPHATWLQASVTAQPFGLSRQGSFAKIHQQLLEQYAPPSVLVNYQAQILHHSDHAGHFLHYNHATPLPNLLMLVQPKLRLALRAALFQAIRSDKSVEAQQVHLRRAGNTAFITMRVCPVHDGQGDFLLVLFDEVQNHYASAEGEALEDCHPHADQDECLGPDEKKLHKPQDRVSRDSL